MYRHIQRFSQPCWRHMTCEWDIWGGGRGIRFVLVKGWDGMQHCQDFMSWMGTKKKHFSRVAHFRCLVIVADTPQR